MGKTTTTRADLPGNLPRKVQIGRLEIDIVGDQYLASAHDDRPGGRVQGWSTQVGRLSPISGRRFPQSLELASSDVFEGYTVAPGGSCSVEIHWNAKFMNDALAG